MSLEDLNKNPKFKIEESFLIDQQQQFTVEDDFSYFCMYDDLMGNENIPVEEYEEDIDTPKESQIPNPLMDFIKNLTIDEYNECLEIISYAQIQASTKKRIVPYFKGKISPSELLENADEQVIYSIYCLINRVLNYRNKDTRYYIKLPVDMFFYTKEICCIVACKLDESFEDLEMLNLIGPNDFDYGTYVIKEYLEIDGDFSQIPNGARLEICDYLQIMKRYPNIIAHLSHLMKTDYQFSREYADKNDDEMRKLASEHLQRWLGWYPKPDEEISKSEKKREGVTVLSQETIDSITFVQPVEYVTLEEIKNGTFGTFEELLARANTFQTPSLQDEERQKTFQLNPPKNT